MKFQIAKHTLKFRFIAGTSRGSLTEKETWFVKIWNDGGPGNYGIGECSPLKGLSIDYSPDYERHLSDICKAVFSGEDQVLNIPEALSKVPLHFPSIRFGIETAILDLKNGGNGKIFDCGFYDRQIPIPINGLIWMGGKDFMLEQIREKLAAGFDTIKIKVGAIDHSSETDLLKFIRNHFTREEIALRLDANGAFHKKNVFSALEEFARFDIHSIEQPVKQGQTVLMKAVCEKSPIPIALDEELIEVFNEKEQVRLLDSIKPQYIILKPSLTGGLTASEKWIDLAEERGVGWWMTSLLESNIGLNAIAQFASKMNVTLPQGLGTGQLYHNNISAPLQVENGKLLYNCDLKWETDCI